MRLDSVEKMLRCRECGSERIDVDRVELSRYCKDCGMVMEELLVAEATRIRSGIYVPIKMLQ